MTQDLYGLPVSHADDETLHAINDFIHGFIAFEPKATNVMVAAENSPDCCLANAYTAMLWMMLESPAAPEKAKPFLARAESKLDTNTARERMFVRAVRLWANGDVPGCIKQCDDILTDYPRDMPP